jgi:hypothetical protein
MKREETGEKLDSHETDEKDDGAFRHDMESIGKLLQLR